MLHLREECLKPLRTFTKKDNRKIEAVVHLPDGQDIWGTDDENHGGSVLFDRTGLPTAGNCGPSAVCTQA